MRNVDMISLFYCITKNRIIFSLFYFLFFTKQKCTSHVHPSPSPTYTNKSLGSNLGVVGFSSDGWLREAWMGVQGGGARCSGVVRLEVGFTKLGRANSNIGGG